MVLFAEKSGKYGPILRFRSRLISAAQAPSSRWEIGAAGSLQFDWEGGASTDTPRHRSGEEGNGARAFPMWERLPAESVHNGVPNRLQSRFEIPPVLAHSFTRSSMIRPRRMMTRSETTIAGRSDGRPWAPLSACVSTTGRSQTR